eukprot:TRINITY_DN3627_c0_g1_i2.p1 TRINITY_DN3627_c0_g1~~TRINITY_DN3627_c0_g1_i2.p1  ORF type:complete len:180 (+),score=39.84 TRINITY_DN3627_c0_g1_i2:143-682(+)
MFQRQQQHAHLNYAQQMPQQSFQQYHGQVRRPEVQRANQKKFVHNWTGTYRPTQKKFATDKEIFENLLPYNIWYSPIDKDESKELLRQSEEDLKKEAARMEAELAKYEKEYTKVLKEKELIDKTEAELITAMTVCRERVKEQQAVEKRISQQQQLQHMKDSRKSSEELFQNLASHGASW